MVTRGYLSLSFPHQAAAYINGLEKPTTSITSGITTPQV